MYLGLLVLGNVCKHLVGGIKISTQDKRLVFNDGERKGERNDLDILVGDVDTTIARNVSENVMGRVEV